MKKFYNWTILSIIITISLGNVYGQSNKALEIKEKLWEKSGADFRVTETPDKWDKKSAVIIALDYEQSYHKQPIIGILNYYSHKHERVKILANNVLEEYSQFTIPIGRRVRNIDFNFYAGFKVIKSSGEEIEIPLTDAVKEEREINGRSFDNLKLAIPNLQVGDIIDYYIAEEREITLSSVKYYSFDPFIFQLSAQYPIMYQKISFDISRRCFLNVKSLNGAPAFRAVKEEEKDFYSVEDRDREDVNGLRWFYENRQLPTIKYKVTYGAPLVVNNIPSFLGEQRKKKNSVSKEEIKSFVASLRNSSAYIGNQLIYSNKSKFKKESNKKKIAISLFYEMRNKFRIQEVEERIINGGSQNPRYASYKYVFALSHSYKKFKVPHKVLIGIPREISDIDDVIMENELDYMIRVDLDKPYYLSAFDNFGVFGQSNFHMEGTEMYEVNGLDNSNDWRLKKTMLPRSEYSANNGHTNLVLKLDEPDGILMAEVEKLHSGYNKVYYQNTLLDYYDYVESEKIKYKMTNPRDSYNKKGRLVFDQKKKSYLDKRSENRNEIVKAHIKSDYDYEIEDVKDFKIINSGRNHTEPVFSYSYQVDFSDALKKLGENYLINIGQLIEGQVDIQKEEMERKYDVHMNYPRSYSHQITLKIPDGYEVQGLDKLVVNEENNIGGFVCETNLEDNVITVSTKKYYATNYVAKEEWNKLVGFLKLAKDFNGKNILLKKTE